MSHHRLSWNVISVEFFIASVSYKSHDTGESFKIRYHTQGWYFEETAKRVTKTFAKARKLDVVVTKVKSLGLNCRRNKNISMFSNNKCK